MTANNANGKGSNTAKRTNFKKFNEGWDKINWNDDKPTTSEKSIGEKTIDLQKDINELKHILDKRTVESGSISREENRNNFIGE